MDNLSQNAVGLEPRQTMYFDPSVISAGVRTAFVYLSLGVLGTCCWIVISMVGNYIHTRLLKYPLYHLVSHIIEKFLLLFLGFVHSFWTTCCFVYTILAQFMVFSFLAQYLFNTNSFNFENYNLAAIVVAAVFGLSAAYEDLVSKISNSMSSRTGSIFQRSWYILNWAGIVLRCGDIVPSPFRPILDCFAMLHILRILSRLGICSFGLQTLELAPWDYSGPDVWRVPSSGWGSRYVSKPYNIGKLFEAKYEVTKFGFGAFWFPALPNKEFYPSGGFALDYSHYATLLQAAIPATIVLGVWGRNCPAIFSIINIITLYVVAPIVVSTAEVILSSKFATRSLLSKLSSMSLALLILNVWLLLLSFQILHVAQYIVGLDIQCGWTNFSRALAFFEGCFLLVTPLVQTIYSAIKSFFWPPANRRELVGALMVSEVNFLAVLKLLVPNSIVRTILLAKSLLRRFLPGQGRREWVVLGNLSGFPVSAIPDTGSDLDIVSSDFVKRNGITIDSKTLQYIQLPNGRTISTGTVKLPFLFEGEKSTFSRVFTVMPNCLHDVILSNSFLRTTETLTKFSQRLKCQFVHSVHVPRLRLLGAPRQRIWGSINGRTIAAVPDTGSDVMLMSKRYTRKLGLKILRDERHRTCLEFADGTLANTCGMVFGVQWRFGGQNSTSRDCDFHVMEDLPYKVILSNDFLFKSKAFTQFKDFFFEQRNDTDMSRVFHELSLIKIVGPQNKAISRIHGFYRRFLKVVKGTTGNAGQKEQNCTVQDQEHQLRRELQRQDVAEELIAELSSEQQEAAWATERRCREQWTKTHPPDA